MIEMDGLKNFKADAIIFDKDGTLIDFDFMWGGWAVYLAEQLHQASGRSVATRLYDALGYDEKSKKVLAHGKLASSPMTVLYDLTVEVMQSFGLNRKDAERMVEEYWRIPDPVLLAKPFTNLHDLFGKLQHEKIKVAIATADDRAPTQALIEAFDIEELIATMVCADDGIPVKPSPDMVTTICERIGVSPSRIMVIGDTVSDLKMGRAAGAGLCVGVLSGVSNPHDLTPYADVLIESVHDLHLYMEGLVDQRTRQAKNGFNPDFAY